MEASQITSVRDLVPYGLHGAYLVLLLSATSKLHLRHLHDTVIPVDCQLFREDLLVLEGHWTPDEWKRRTKKVPKPSDEQVLEWFNLARVKDAHNAYTASPYYINCLAARHEQVERFDRYRAADRLSRLLLRPVEKDDTVAWVRGARKDGLYPWVGIGGVLMRVGAQEEHDVLAGKRTSVWQVWVETAPASLTLRQALALREALPRGQAIVSFDHDTVRFQWQPEEVFYIRSAVTPRDDGSVGYLAGDGYLEALKNELSDLGVRVDQIYRAEARI